MRNNIVLDFKEKGVDNKYCVRFVLDSFPSDCGTRIISNVFMGLPPKIEVKEKRNIIYWMLRRILGDVTYGNKKIICSYKPNLGWGTGDFAKLIRCKHVNSVGAHGQYDFKYGIKELHDLRKYNFPFHKYDIIRFYKESQVVVKQEMRKLDLYTELKSTDD